MNIKSLLLGSAAAMVAVSTAHAADAVVVEPEPVEYVRVCDAYGSGFFYIPGTETCLGMSGYVRSYFGVAHQEVDGNETGFTEWASRARIGFDTRNETDWGTLRGFFRFDTDTFAAGNSNASLDRAVISLAGFRAGQDTNYWTSNHGFAGVNLAGLNPGGDFGAEDGPYSGTTTAATVFDYTWAQDGFSITGGVQNIDRDLNNATIAGGDVDYYAGFNWSADWGGVAFTWVNDSNATDPAGNNTDGDAWKVSVDLDLSEWIPGGLIHGMYMDDGDDATSYVAWGPYLNASTIWQISAQMDLTDELQLAGQYSDIEDDSTAGADGYMFGIGLNWTPAAAPGFEVYTSYAYGEADNVTNGGIAGVTAGTSDLEYDAWTIALRRNF